MLEWEDVELPAMTAIWEEEHREQLEDERRLRENYPSAEEWIEGGAPTYREVCELRALARSLEAPITPSPPTSPLSSPPPRATI